MSIWADVFSERYDGAIAQLAMLIEACPDEHWNAPVWRVQLADRHVWPIVRGMGADLSDDQRLPASGRVLERRRVCVARLVREDVAGHLPRVEGGWRCRRRDATVKVDVERNLPRASSFSTTSRRCESEGPPRP
jgi:hypothetical protein